MFSGINDPSRWILPAVLEEMAARKTEQDWITTTEGEHVSFGDMATDVAKVAGYFSSLGVESGDFVAVWLPNNCDFVRVWLGLGRLGAVAVLLNTGLTGAFLEHQLNDSGATMMVVDSNLLAELDTVANNLAYLNDVIIVGLPDKPCGNLRRLPWQAWHDATPWRGPLPQASDIAAVMYTSGTTGPSKGVLMPHAHCTLYGIGQIECMQITAEDKFYIVLPLFHANGLLMQLGATLLAGIPAVIRRKFSASYWLDDVRRSGATVTNNLGTTAAFIANQPPTAHDRDHGMRMMVNVPNLPAHESAFHDRFGIPEVISGFGMTEVNIPIWGRKGVSAPGAAGWVHEQHFDVVIADPQTGMTMPPNQLGEILVRPKVPFGFMAGYHNLADKTVEAWQNLWFHTDDAGVMSEDGLVTFVDRIKDCIRRRGENISPAEIEAVVSELPEVAEVAACAVPSDIPGTEDEIMLAIVLAPEYDTTLDPVEFGHRVDLLLPRFARPRFLRFIDGLPKTATGKVRRQVLKQVGLEQALDRNALAS